MNIYIFGDGQAEGSAEMKNLLSGKGANLAEMTSAELPVPPGVDTLNVSGLFQYKFFSAELLASYTLLSGQITNYTCPPYRY
ncbi:hypothetical protein RW64_01795 [Geobacter sulfurreducens]|nr:hypothetical protein RW64_01795 [Geobacter sulfurreducens]